MKNKKINIILTSIFFVLCSINAFSMVPRELEEKSLTTTNNIRHTLLTKLISDKNINIVSVVDFPCDGRISPTPIEPDLSDKILAYDQYELIGTSSGDLKVITSSTFKTRQKAHRSAISSITAKDKLVATGSYSSYNIRRWNIDTLDLHDEIKRDAGTIFIRNINNLFFIVDTNGCISILDWETTTQLCQIRLDTEEMPILNATLNEQNNILVIITKKACIYVNIDSLICIDTAICELNESQIALLKNYTKLIHDANLSRNIKNLIEDFIEQCK